MTAMLSFLVEPHIELASHQSERGVAAWLASHQPKLIEFRDDPESFGNFLLTVGKGVLRVRFVGDRGTLLVSVGDGGSWHQLETIWAFIHGRALGESDGEGHWPEFDPFDDHDKVLEAIRDPELLVFEASADRRALEQMGFAID